jgi:uncharacterized protein involved in outer membrane biogenesis
MLKRALAGAAVLTLLVVVGLYFFTRSILASDAVRETLTAQVSKAIGQPVSIASIDATIFPRITVRLGGVAIGQPAKIQVQTLNVGTNLRALLSRRIEHASLRLEGAHIALPLPAFSIGSGEAPPSEDTAGGAPVELVSIDEVVLEDIEIESGGRTLRADIEAVPEGKGIAVRRLTLRAEDTTIEATGNLADLAGPTGELALKADALNLDRMVTFLSGFSAGAGVSSPKQPKVPVRARAAKGKPVTSKPGMNIVLTLDANRATLGTLALDRLSGRARVTDRALTLDPMTFGLFKGRYEGTMVLDLGESEGFQLKASVAAVDVAAAMAFAGVPNTMTGEMSGRIDVAGRGLDAAGAMKSARGTVRLDVKDGIVKNLGLLRTVVLATSMRGDREREHLDDSSPDEPFSRLGATLRIGNGVAATNDLQFESEDVSLRAGGTVALDGSLVNLRGNVQLSEALSRQSGNDLQRYANEDGRVTLPVTVTGPVEDLSVGFDTGAAATRAITNRATEEVEKGLKKLGGLFR